MKKALLIAVALAVVGFGGWKYMQNRDKTPVTTNSNTAQQQTKDTSEGGKYLVIKEWGVKLPLEENVKDVSYKLNNSNDISLTNPALEDFSNKHPECNPFAVLLQRIKPGDDHFGSPWTKEELESLATEIDGYYYKQEVGKPCEGREHPPETPENITLIRTSLSKSIQGIVRE